jgi:hypothetical protein
MTVNFCFKEDEDDLWPAEQPEFLLDDEESIVDWFQRTRPSTKQPKWINDYLELGCVGDESGLISYLVRLSPLTEEPPFPELLAYERCGIFEFRKPELCPLGIQRKVVLGRQVESYNAITL